MKLALLTLLKVVVDKATGTEKEVGLAWEETVFPFLHTLYESLVGGTLAVVQVNPEHRNRMVKALANLASYPQTKGWSLDFATSARKSGQAILSLGKTCSKLFWKTAEEAIAYGSILLTPCWGARPRSVKLTILVVPEGDEGTGDCHGKASRAIYTVFDMSRKHAAQFRLGSLREGFLAKGTFAVGPHGGLWLAKRGQGHIDLVLPRSCFKSSAKPEENTVYTLNAVMGVVSWSRPLPTKLGWQVLQWFSWAAVQKDILPYVKETAEQLVRALADNRALAELLHLYDVRGIDPDDIEADEEAPQEDEGTILLDILRADNQGFLSQHPHVVRKVSEMLRRRWQHLATGGGQFMTGLMGLPDDSLPFGVVATHELPYGKVIVTRYPVRFWGDVRLWKNVEPSQKLKGVVWMSHKTAAILGGDFDGDYFQLVPAADFPALTADMKTWKNRPNVEVIKVKDRRQTPISPEGLAKVLMDNTDNLVGKIALLIARAGAAGNYDLVVRLAQELQISVDKFKFNVDNDLDFIDECDAEVPQVAWVWDRKHKAAFHSRPMKVHPKATDTISRLVREVNALWVPYKGAALPIWHFKGLFPQPENHMDAARGLAARYAINVSRALAADDSKAMSKLFKSIEAWATEVEDPQEWAAAIWNAVHAKGNKGTGSLAFAAFPSEIAGKVAGLPLVPEVPTKATIVGLEKNEWADNLNKLNGVHQVMFDLSRLNGEVRWTARVDGRVVGFVSKETPVPTGTFDMGLAVKGACLYATAPN